MTNQPIGDLLRIERDDDVLVVTINHPPVNALSHAVRVGLMAAADALDHTPDVRAMVLRSTGTVFIGGADIKEFGGPRLAPMLNEVCDRLELCTKPIVAALHGAALGGGFEIALAAHARIAAPSADVAFPEVLLGLLPGAGGTQRAPRLAGAAIALDLMLTGRRMPAAEAVACGLLDALADDPFAAALALVRRPEFLHAPVRRSRDGTALRDRSTQRDAIARARASLDVQYANLFSPARIVEAVDVAVTHDFTSGCAREGALFLECLASPQRQALVHVFFGEREVRTSLAAGVSLEAIGALLCEARDAADPSTSLPRMADAGRRALELGIARRPIDVDIASIRFAAFPRYRGGVMYAAALAGVLA